MLDFSEALGVMALLSSFSSTVFSLDVILLEVILVDVTNGGGVLLAWA